MGDLRKRREAAGFNWRWYSGGWNDALANNNTANDKLFQFHHQPFAYYTKYAPFLTPPALEYSASMPPQLNPATTGPNAHLQDEQNFFKDVASGNLPPVSFIKPIGKNNEHPGYSDVITGQQHVAELVAAVQHSNIWKDCVIIITYDENGGRGIMWLRRCAGTAGVLACASLASLSHRLLAAVSSITQNMRLYRY